MPSPLNRILVLLHGEQPFTRDVLLVYVIGGAVGFFILAQNLSSGVSLSILQVLVLFVLAFDITGGVIANSTWATNRWYHQRPLQIRLLFVVVHLAHPLLAILILDPANWAFFATVYLYMLLSASFVLMLPPSMSQRPVALGLYVIGVVGSAYLLDPVVSLRWFAPVYFAKLIVCFAVYHYGTRHQTSAQCNLTNEGRA